MVRRRRDIGLVSAAWVLALGTVARAAPPTTSPATAPADARYTIGPLVESDDFDRDSAARWVSELENGGRVAFGDGVLDIDVPRGATVWFKTKLTGPVLIEYQATAISAGGANDRVSDINCFWMATDSRNPADLFAVKRGGAFAEYNPLLTYYVGLGGNGNTTTRFRRYIGDATTRPLLPEHDLTDAAHLLTANKPQLLQLIACGPLIQYFRDGQKYFEMNDPKPYTEGHFGLRTTQNHMLVTRFRVYQIKGR